MPEVKFKLYGQSREAILEVSDQIRNLYAPNIVQSPVKDSEPSGYHCFLTVYTKEAQR